MKINKPCQSNIFIYSKLLQALKLLFNTNHIEVRIEPGSLWFKLSFTSSKISTILNDKTLIFDSDGWSFCVIYALNPALHK